MNSMFEGCKSLTELDLSTWSLNTNKVTMESMFSGDDALVTVYVSTLWKKSNITAASYMFSGCTSIKGASGYPYQNAAATPGSSNYAEVSSTGYLSAKHFVSGSAYWSLSGTGDLVLEAIADNYGEIATIGDSATSTAGAPWASCASNIKRFWINEGDTIGVAATGYTNNMFYNCSNMTYCDLRGLDTTNSNGMYRMFYGCNNIEELYLDAFDVANVQSMEQMFYNCSKITKLNLRIVHHSARFHDEGDVLRVLGAV